MPPNTYEVHDTVIQGLWSWVLAKDAQLLIKYLARVSAKNLVDKHPRYKSLEQAYPASLWLYRKNLATTIARHLYGMISTGKHYIEGSKQHKSQLVRSFRQVESVYRHFRHESDWSSVTRIGRLAAREYNEEDAC